jgi:hypothetical protein
MTKQSGDDEKRTRLIEDVIDEGANTAEEINRAVLGLPVTVLESLGLEGAASEVKKVQDSTIGAIYELIHDVNYKVAALATQLLEQRESDGK